MSDDPYSDIASPVAQTDPYAGIGSEVAQSAPPRWLKTKDPLTGKSVTFSVPSDASDDEIKLQSLKALGLTGRSVDVSGTHGDDSALRGLGLGAVKPLDFIGRELDRIPGVEAIDRALSPDGKSATEQHADYADAVKNNSRTGFQTLGNIAGVAPLALIPGANTSLAGLAATGAAGGALLSDGTDAQDVARSAGIGAVGSIVGGKLLAPAAAALGRGAVAGGRTLAGKLAAPAVSAATDIAPAASDRTTGILLKTLAAQGQTPDEAVSAIAAAKDRGVPLALMDTGDETRGLASALARAPGDSRTTLRAVVGPRQDAQLDRIQSAIADNLGPVANVRQQSQALMKDASSAASPLYRKFEASSATGSDELESLLNTPAGKQAIARARVIAANERRDPAELGIVLDDKGEAVLNPLPQNEIAAHLDARAGLDDAQDAYRVARSTAGADIGKARTDLESARSTYRNAARALAASPDPETAQSTRVYTPQTIDYVKRGLDDVVEQFRDKTTGRLVLDEAGRAINGVRAQFRAEADRLYPDYKAARDAYAGPTALSAALKKGSSVANKDADTILAETENLGPSELEQYKLGARSAIYKALENRVDGSDKVRALIGSQKKRSALAQLFGGGGKFDNFMSALGNEGQAAQTYGRIYTGSPSAANLADDGHMGGLTGVAVNAGERALRGTGLVHNAVSTLADLYRYGAGEAGARVRAELARTISTMNPDELQAFQQAAQRLGQQKLKNLGQANAVAKVTAPALTGAVAR